MRSLPESGTVHPVVMNDVLLPHTSKQGIDMNLTLSLAPLVSLIAGILILVVPRLLNYIVALYLIIIGVIGLVG